jgi:glycogen phosphorylase
VLDMIASGYFSPGERDRHLPISEALTHHGDRYLVLADYASYIVRQQEVEALYRDKDAWIRKSILNVARMGRFSSDRTVREYAEMIWGVAPVAQRRALRAVA